MPSTASIQMRPGFVDKEVSTLLAELRLGNKVMRALMSKEHTVLDFGFLKEFEVHDVGETKRVESSVPRGVLRNVLRLGKERNGSRGLSHSHGSTRSNGLRGEFRTAYG